MKRLCRLALFRDAIAASAPLAARRFTSAPVPPSTQKPAVPPPANDDADDESGPMISTRGAVEASYEQWASATGSCTLSDLTRGVKQAYTALGVVLDASIRVPKPELEKQLEQFLRKDGALAGSTAATSSTAAASPSMDASPTSALDAGASRTANTISTAGGPTLDSLPLGSSFKFHLAMALKAGSQGAFNPFQFAHANDFVVEAKLQSFETFQPTKVAIEQFTSTTDGGAAAGKKKKTQSPAVAEPTADPEGSSPSAGGGGADAKPLHEHDTSTSVAPNHSDSIPSPIVEISKKAPGAPAVVPDIVDLRVTISTTVPPTFIPRSAKAYVLMTLFVVAPPRRFHAPFEWFYQRIRGHESDNERVALANVFAASTAFGLMKVFDHIVRLATGHPAEFVATRTATSMMRLPADMTNKMLVKRKYIGMYLSKDGEWTISELTNSGEEYDYEVPGSGIAPTPPDSSE
jgi:hypothetical protein